MKELTDKITVKQKDVTDRQKKVEEMREVNVNEKDKNRKF